VRNSLGNCFWELEEHEDALRNYKEAIKRRQKSSKNRKPDGVLALFHADAGKFLYSLDRFMEATTELEISKEIYNEIDDPELASTAHWLGDCFLELGKQEDASKNYEEAIEK